jgi:hypothetical protein
MFIAPGITPPYADLDRAFAGRPAPADLVVRGADNDAL